MRLRSIAPKLLVIGAATSAIAAPRAAHAGQPAFVYVNANPNNASNFVSGFRVGLSGQSTPIAGSPFPTGGAGLAAAPAAEFAHRIEVSRARNLLFAANDGAGTISAFTVNPTTGQLAAVAGSPFAVPGWGSFSGISLAVSSDGRFLYASGQTLVSFFVDSTGSLFPLGSQWQFPQRVGGVAVPPDNLHLFVSTSSGVYIMNTGEGGLTSEPPNILSIGSTATDLRLDPTGSHLWVGTKNGGILSYSVAGSTATVVPGAPFFSGVTELSGLSADFYGRFLFAYSAAVPRLFGAHSNADGTLVAAPNTPLTPLYVPTAGALIPDGSLLFVTNAQAQLDAWTTQEDGSLFHADGYPVATGAPRGFASVATFPEKSPTPAPASPYWLTLALASALSLVGAARLRLRAR